MIVIVMYSTRVVWTQLLNSFRQVVLTLAIGATVLGGYMYYRFENTLSFEYTGVEDEKKAAEALAGEGMSVRSLRKVVQ